MERVDTFWLVVSVIAACIKLAFVYATILLATVFEYFASAVVFLFETWVFQAVFGAWVVFALQQIHQKSTQRAELIQKRYDQKVAAVQAFFALIDKRIYASRVYLAALRSSPEDQSWLAERERYRDAVREWNEKAPSVLVTMLTLLPARLCYKIERDTFLPFSQMDRILGRIRNGRTNGTAQSAAASEIQDLLSELAFNSNIALAEFLNLTKEEQKRIDQKPKISEENITSLSFGYLVVSLFKTTID